MAVLYNRILPFRTVIMPRPRHCGWALRFALLRRSVRPSCRTYKPKACVRNSSFTPLMDFVHTHPYTVTKHG